MIYDESFFAEKLIDDYLQVNLTDALLMIIKAVDFKTKKGDLAVNVFFKVIDSKEGQQEKVFNKIFVLSDKAKYFYRTLAMICGFCNYQEDGELHLQPFESKELIGKQLIADVFLDGVFYTINDLRMPKFTTDK